MAVPAVSDDDPVLSRRVRVRLWFNIHHYTKHNLFCGELELSKALGGEGGLAGPMFWQQLFHRSLFRCH